MTEEHQSAALTSFLFGEGDFTEELPESEYPDDPTTPILQAFRANLQSAVRVGNIPFQLVHNGVLNKRYTQLLIAEKIRCKTKVDRGQISEQETDEEAHRCAQEGMAAELRDQAVINRHANETVNTLNDYLKDIGFSRSSQELLRHVLVMIWSAFEVLASDTLRTLLNAKPVLIKAFADSRPYRDFLSARLFMEALEENEFNLSASIGDVFCDAVNLNSLEKIKDAIRSRNRNPRR